MQFPKNNFLLLFGFLTFLLFACKKEKIETVLDDPTLVDLSLIPQPEGFPFPSIPENNLPTKARIALGKKLFFDPILSRDKTISCSSCHIPQTAFTDARTVAVGIDNKPGIRNTIGLINVAYQQHFFMDGGVPTLELQVLAPFDNENEFDINILEVIERLKADEEYVQLFDLAYNRAPDAFGITRAIANFERTLIAGNTPYDKYYFQQQNDALNDAELRGLAIFNSEKTQCSSCHSGFNFTNFGFAHNGLDFDFDTDPGKYRTSLRESDLGLFKIPSLRNLKYTAPYMRDGRFNTLEEVIDHYASGGVDHPNKSVHVKGFQLSESEKKDLIEFLLALSEDELDFWFSLH